MKWHLPTGRLTVIVSNEVFYEGCFRTFGYVRLIQALLLLQGCLEILVGPAAKMRPNSHHRLCVESHARNNIYMISMCTVRRSIIRLLEQKLLLPGTQDESVYINFLQDYNLVFMYLLI